MNILIDMLVEVLKAIAIATRYCDAAIQRAKGMKKVKKVFSRRASMVYSLTGCDVIADYRRLEDYLVVLVDDQGVQEVLRKLERLATREEQVAVAAIYASVRKGNLLGLSRPVLVNSLTP